MRDAPARLLSTEEDPQLSSAYLSALSPEARLVLLTAGGADCDDEIRELLRQTLDWNKVVWLAEREGAVPILWKRASQLAGASLPADVSTHLQRLALVSEFQLLRLEQRLGEAIDLLSAAGIDVILLKGAALACTVYGSFSQRPMGDVDLLVPPARANAAMAALTARGWMWKGDEALQHFYEGHHHLPPLEDQTGSGARLELHTAFFFEGHPFRLSLADVRENAVEVPFGSRTVRVPDTPHQLLHLCLHFVWSHMVAMGAWRAFRDLRTLMEVRGIEWDEFARFALESRGGSCCYWTFRLARDLIGLNIPTFVLDALRPPQPEYVLRRVEQHFTYQLLPTEGICPSLRVAQTMWRTGICPAWSGHGAVRPWDRSDGFPVRERPAATGARKLADHLGNARGWAHYIRAIVHPAALSG